MVQLSISESRTLCKRVIAALGFPAGSDAEIADAIVWLATMRIVPLSCLADQLPSLHYKTRTADCIRRMSSVEFEVNVDPSIEHLLLTEVADLLCASAMRQGRPSRATIRNMRNAALLLPVALQRSLESVRFEITLSEFRSVIENGQLWLNCDLEATGQLQFQGSGAVICSHSRAPGRELPARQSDLMLKFRTGNEIDAGSNRIEVNQRDYLILKQKAAESFVPNSELSRRSGAGAEVDDSE